MARRVGGQELGITDAMASNLRATRVQLQVAQAEIDRLKAELSTAQATILSLRRIRASDQAKIRRYQRSEGLDCVGQLVSVRA